MGTLNKSPFLDEDTEGPSGYRAGCDFPKRAWQTWCSTVCLSHTLLYGDCPMLSTLFEAGFENYPSACGLITLLLYFFHQCLLLVSISWILVWFMITLTTLNELIKI